ncbi:MAG: hypothetical protein KGI41_01970 [Patescibacteria group bacterium]|nr:hypothetical protein [Patescibacteria group bacterium]
MGDGGMSRYQVIVSLNSRDDSEYIEYVSRRIHELFGIMPGIYPDREACVSDIVISRAKVVGYLNGLGLPIGNKIRQGLDMPAWVKRNPAFARACVRGLVDTDGCVFIHRYKVKGKWYAYKKLQFTSASPALVASVSSVLMQHGLRTRIARNGRDVRLDSVADVK